MSLTKVASKRPKLALSTIDKSLLLLVPVQASSSCTIDCLPDDALLHIFAYFSLQEIISIFRHVCTRWNAVIFTLCASKRSLKLLTYPNPASLLGRDLPLLPPAPFARLRLRPIGQDHHLLIRRSFNLQTCAFFHRLFPRIEGLLIEECHSIFLPTLDTLLSGWPTLVSFSLYGALSKGSGARQQTQLYQPLGRQASLRSLDLLADGLLGVRTSLKQIAPILDRLEHFSCRIRGSRIKDYFLRCLSHRCTSLWLESFPRMHSHLRASIGSVLAQTGAPFTTVTTLVITQTELTRECFTYLASTFPGLTQLTLDWGYRSRASQKNLLIWEQLIVQLGTLPSLSALCLRLPILYLNEWLIKGLPPSDDVCTSVQTLSLQLVVFNWRELFILSDPELYNLLACAFPSLHSLAVIPVRCSRAKAEDYRTAALRETVHSFAETLWPKGQVQSVTVEEPFEGLGQDKEAYPVKVNHAGESEPESGQV